MTPTEQAVKFAKALIGECVLKANDRRGIDLTPDQTAAVYADAEEVATYLAEHGALIIADEAERRTNLDDAAEIIAEIDTLRAVQRELRSAFARSELDGGAKAAPMHPLYADAEGRLAQLHDALMILI